MKPKKPEIVPMYRTSGGTTVGTLDEWKKAELTMIASGADNPFELIVKLLEHADEAIAILAVKERGRPVGAKDRKPRKRAVAPFDGRDA